MRRKGDSDNLKKYISVFFSFGSTSYSIFMLSKILYLIKTNVDVVFTWYWYFQSLWKKVLYYQTFAPFFIFCLLGFGVIYTNLYRNIPFYKIPNASILCNVTPDCTTSQFMSIGTIFGIIIGLLTILSIIIVVVITICKKKQPRTTWTQYPTSHTAADYSESNCMSNYPSFGQSFASITPTSSPYHQENTITIPSKILNTIWYLSRIKYSLQILIDNFVQ